MTLDLKYLGQMTNLTEIRLKGLSGMKLTSLPTFENLVNLKTLVSNHLITKLKCILFDYRY